MNERLSLFVEAVRNCNIVGPILVIIDADQITRFINESGCRLLGWSEEDVIGKNWFDNFVPEGEREKVREIFSNLVASFLKSDYNIHFENDILRKDGSRATIAWHNSIIKDPSGNFLGTLSMGIDVTLRRELEKKFRLLAGSMDKAIFQLDDEFNIINIDLEVAKMFGYELEEVIGRPVTDFIFEEDMTSYRELMEQSRHGKIGRRELRFRCRDGSPLWISSSYISNFDEEGRFRGILGIIFDITDRKRVEQIQERLAQKSKLETIGHVSGGIAHDFNNVLTVIKNVTRLAMSEFGNPEALLKRLEVIEQASKRAENLTRQLLTFARAQLIEPKVVDLNDLVKNMYDMISRLIGENIEVQMFLDAELAKVNIDITQMEQVIMNLVVNARDAMPDGGKIVIETSNVFLDDDYCSRHPDIKVGKYVQLTVSDTGCGMSEEIKAHIFEPFFTTKEPGEGTGLGLAVVYGIVRQHDGHIECYSEPNKGTTFKIYLPPASVQELAVQEEVKHVEESFGNETVLVVEDNKAVREVTVESLRHLGYNVLEASDGQTALEIAQQYNQDIHILLTDLVMPEISGKQLAEKIKQIHPEVKVLYTSGYTRNVISHHGILDTGVNFISKPYEMESLGRKLREVLAKDSLK